MIKILVATAFLLFNAYIYHYFANKGGFGANQTEDGWMNVGGFQNPGGTPSASLERVRRGPPGEPIFGSRCGPSGRAGSLTTLVKSASG